MSACACHSATSLQPSAATSDPLHQLYRPTSLRGAPLSSSAEVRAFTSCRSAHARLQSSTPRKHCAAAARRSEVFTIRDEPVVKEDAEDGVVEKACVVCGKSFPLKFYQRLKHSVDGHFAQCRGCVYEDKQRRRAVGRVDVEGYPPTNSPIRCKNCDTLLPANFFPVASHCKSGRNRYCLVCKSEKDQARLPPTSIPDFKVCYGPLCNGASKPAAEFSPDRSSPNGLYPNCKQCEASLSRQRYQRVKARPFAIADAASSADAYCGDCGELKPPSEFCKRSAVRSGRPSICKPCNSERNKAIRAGKQASKGSS